MGEAGHPVKTRARAGFGGAFRLTMITNDPVLAAHADAAGVDRVGIDLEVLGKQARQSVIGGRISGHSLADLQAMAPELKRARAFVRINPLNVGSQDEIEAVLSAGAQDVMLPYFHSPSQVEQFVRLIDGRARAVILIETQLALAHAREILAVSGVDEAMLGLNDLSVDLAMSSPFEVLVSGRAALAAEDVAQAGVVFSVGAVTRPDADGLPVDPDLVLAQYPRLGATGAWLSRAFMAQAPDAASVANGVLAIRAGLDRWAVDSPEVWERARVQLAESARQFEPQPLAK